jgi:hypothetical protein
MSEALIFLVGAMGGALGGFFLGTALRSTRPAIDLPEARWIEVAISDDRRRLRVNTEDGMVLRAYGIETLVIKGRPS